MKESEQVVDWTRGSFRMSADIRGVVEIIGHRYTVWNGTISIVRPDGVKKTFQVVGVKVPEKGEKYSKGELSGFVIELRLVV